MKTEFFREYKRRIRLILIFKLNGKNKIKVIKSWATVIMRCGAGVLQWRFDEPNELDRKVWKLFTMYKGLHPKSDVDRFYVRRNVTLAEDFTLEDW